MGPKNGQFDIGDPTTWDDGDDPPPLTEKDRRYADAVGAGNPDYVDVEDEEDPE